MSASHSDYSSLESADPMKTGAHRQDECKTEMRGTNRNGWCIRIVYSILICTIMVGSVLFNVVVYVRLTEVQQGLNILQGSARSHKVTQAQVAAPQVCVPCSFFAYSSSEKGYQLQNFTISEVQSGEKCCVNASDGNAVQELIQRGVDRQLQREKAKGSFGAVQHIIVHQKDGKNYSSWDNKPVAHLLGNVGDQKHLGPFGVPDQIRTWLIPGQHRNTVLKNGLTYRDGRIIISTEGLYYIYSQVFFIESYVVTMTLGEQPEQDKFKHRCHYIYRYSLDYPNHGEDELLRGRATKCWSKNKEFGEYTSHLGGVFHLRRGDELFVKVSNISEISRLALSNNFGLYML